MIVYLCHAQEIVFTIRLIGWDNYLIFAYTSLRGFAFRYLDIALGNLCVESSYGITMLAAVSVRRTIELNNLQPFCVSEPSFARRPWPLLITTPGETFSGAVPTPNYRNMSFIERKLPL